MNTPRTSAPQTAPEADAQPGARVKESGPSAPAPVQDGSAELLRRTLPLMSRHAAGYAPDSYAVWYEYVRGGNPALRAEVDALVGNLERLTPATTFELHQKYLTDRSEESVRKAGAGLLELMNNVRTSVEAASSGASEFDASLIAFGENIEAAETSQDFRQHVDSMRGEVERINRSLNSLTAKLEASHLEVSKLQDELKQAREEAQLDPLSGIMNRRGFEQELFRLCQQSAAQGRPLSLVMVDIDFFKKINDTYGHPFGDLVIRSVGQALSQLTQRKDVAARYGGEEFALLLPDTALSGAREVAERVRSAIARGSIKRGNGQAVGNITISSGVAQFIAGEDPHSLIARADRALYASKQGGRNRVSVDS